MKLVILTIMCMYLIFTGVVVGQITPRFEFIYSQRLNSSPLYIYDIEVLHDKDTGQEVVCINGKSCYPTGRKW